MDQKKFDNSYFCKYAKCGQGSKKATQYPHDVGSTLDSLERFVEHVKTQHEIVWNREFVPFLKKTK